MYISVFMLKKKRETISWQCRYRGMCAISTSGLLRTQNNVTYQISLFLFYAFSYSANIFKVVHFINVFWTGSASLPALKWSETATTDRKLLCCCMRVSAWRGAPRRPWIGVKWDYLNIQYYWLNNGSDLPLFVTSNEKLSAPWYTDQVIKTQVLFPSLDALFWIKQLHILHLTK